MSRSFKKMVSVNTILWTLLGGAAVAAPFSFVAQEDQMAVKAEMVQDYTGVIAFEGDRMVRLRMTRRQLDGAEISSSFMAVRANKPENIPAIIRAEVTGLHVGDQVRFNLSAEQAKVLDNKLDGPILLDVNVVDKIDPVPAPDDVAAPPSDALKTDDGVFYKIIQSGDGQRFPTTADDVLVHYSGWQTNGYMFDSSLLRAAPNRFPLGRLIAGWQSAVPNMSVGGKMRIWIPGALAYDNRPDRPTAPKGMLVFDIELYDFQPSKAAAQ